MLGTVTMLLQTLLWFQLHLDNPLFWASDLLALRLVSWDKATETSISSFSPSDIL